MKPDKSPIIITVDISGIYEPDLFDTAVYLTTVYDTGEDEVFVVDCEEGETGEGHD